MPPHPSIFLHLELGIEIKILYRGSSRNEDHILLLPSEIFIRFNLRLFNIDSCWNFHSSSCFFSLFPFCSLRCKNERLRREAARGVRSGARARRSGTAAQQAPLLARRGGASSRVLASARAGSRAHQEAQPAGAARPGGATSSARSDVHRRRPTRAQSKRQPWAIFLFYI